MAGNQSQEAAKWRVSPDIVIILPAQPYPIRGRKYMPNSQLIIWLSESTESADVLTSRSLL